ncbi:hypothetical protein ACX40Y_14825 [Sphingomonas sp. RS6]
MPAPSVRAATQAPRLPSPALEGFYARGRVASYVLLRMAFGITIMTHGLPKLTGGAHGSMADPMAVR